MSQPYDLRVGFEKTPNVFLEKFFSSFPAFSDLDWKSLAENDTEPILDRLHRVFLRNVLAVNSMESKRNSSSNHGILFSRVQWRVRHHRCQAIDPAQLLKIVRASVLRKPVPHECVRFRPKIPVIGKCPGHAHPATVRMLPAWRGLRDTTAGAATSRLPSSFARHPAALTSPPPSPSSCLQRRSGILGRYAPATR